MLLEGGSVNVNKRTTSRTGLNIEQSRSAAAAFAVNSPLLIAIVKRNIEKQAQQSQPTIRTRLQNASWC